MAAAVDGGYVKVIWSPELSTWWLGRKCLFCCSDDCAVVSTQ